MATDTYKTLLRLDPPHHRAIERSLKRYLDMDGANCRRLMRTILETGSICTFGYGSLMRDPHAKPDTVYAGYVEGFERDMVHLDRHYRGTPRRLSLTMGVVPTQNPRQKLHGLLQVTRFDAGSSSEALARQIMDYIENLAWREVSLNPIYAYKIVDVKNRRGASFPAIMCCPPDNKHPLYIYTLAPPQRNPEAKA
ncbi:MAG: gamma-glutamylcyclotransferase [Bdellovibrionales bacterium]